MVEPGIVVIGSRWHHQHDELAFVIRSIAGAATRFDHLAVLAPGAAGHPHPDGAFEVTGIGSPGARQWPHAMERSCSVIVDQLSPDIVDLLSEVAPRDVFYLSAGDENPDASWRRLPLVPERPDGPFVKLYVPVNPLAEVHRHHGFGFTGYILVLSGRVGTHEDPPEIVAWLSASFHDRDIVLVENAHASAWKGRALRGRVSVDTRMDLWRLLAHADVCIDLAPGAFVARECVESMRFGTPILVPTTSGPALSHAEAGGAAFGSVAELLTAVISLQSGDTRSLLSCRARRYADANFGAPGTLVTSLRDLLGRSES